MSESTEATQAVVETPETQEPRQKQVQEFNGKVLRAIPELDRGFMQHLVEHPGELEARIASAFERGQSNYRFSQMGNLRGFVDDHVLREWKDFYEKEFEASPDFSRVRFPEGVVYSYTQPIYVAPKLSLGEIASVLPKYGIGISSRLEHILSSVVDRDRPTDNYVVFFSHITERPCVLENVDAYVKYRSSCMTLREYLLWLAFQCFRNKDSVNLLSKWVQKRVPLPERSLVFPGNLIDGGIPELYFYYGIGPTFSLRLLSSNSESAYLQYLKNGNHAKLGVHRVLLMKPLKQI